MNFIFLILFPWFAHAIGYADPIFISSTILSNTFPTKEMKVNQLRLKVAPFRFALDASKAHADDPSSANGYGAIVSGVYTKYETEIASYGIGGSLGYFQGTGQSLLLAASSPLEQFMGDHSVRGAFGSITLHVDPTRRIDWFNLPMFIGLSFQALSSSSRGDFVSVNRDGANLSMPFGAVTVDRGSELKGVGLFMGIGPQFVVDPRWLMVTPFTMISVPINKPTETLTLTDNRFIARVPTHDTTSFIPAWGLELSVPDINGSILWVPDRLSQGTSVYTLSWNWDFEM